MKPALANTTPTLSSLSDISSLGITENPKKCIGSSDLSDATFSLHKQNEDIDASTNLIDVDSIQTITNCAGGGNTLHCVLFFDFVYIFQCYKLCFWFSD